MSGEETNNENGLEEKWLEGFWRDFTQCPAIYQYLSNKYR
jgi:hypothetical protein